MQVHSAANTVQADQLVAAGVVAQYFAGPTRLWFRTRALSLNEARKEDAAERKRAIYRYVLLEGQRAKQKKSNVDGQDFHAHHLLRKN